MKQSKSSGYDFNGITARYDLLNRLLSFGMDLGWRKKLSDEVASGETVLDLCSGTGDVARFLTRKTKNLICADISPEMCLKLKQKLPGVQAITADALSLPFSDSSFDAVTIAFGIRNIVDLASGISEIRRVLKKNGKLLILEFTKPENNFSGFFHRAYLDIFVARVGGLISGSPDAYRYLAGSIKNYFSAAEMEAFMAGRNLKPVKTKKLFFNAATLFVFNK